MRLVLAAALVLGSSLRAADAPEPLKKINVVALDGKGQPVTDLTAADFQVFDDNKPQPIVFFHPSPVKAAQTTLAPREYSNRSTPPRHGVAILFDMLNDRLMGDAAVRTEIVDALKNLESSENIYLYLLTPRGELFPIHPLPRTDTIMPPETQPWTRDIAPILDQALKPFVGFHQVDELDPKNRYDESIAALNDVAGPLTELTGRRNLIWVTHGFPIIGYSMKVRARIDLTDPLRAFYSRLAQSEILIYAVDQSRRGAGADPVTYDTETLQEGADLTGGRRLSSDRVGDALNQALTDARANYELAFALPDQKVDKKRHKIRVTTTRKDVKIETIQAYYNLPPVPAETLERTAIGNAIHSPFDATDIGVRASLTPGADGKGQTLNIFIDPADLLLRKSGDTTTGRLEVVIAGFDANGYQQASGPMTFNLSLTAAQLEAASHGGLSMHQPISMKDTTTRIRVVAYDANINAAGSVDVPVHP